MRDTAGWPVILNGVQLELMRGGEFDIGIPESVVDRCDHLAPTLLH